MTVYKKLCAELVEIWDNTSDPDYYDFGDAAKDLVIRARDALAEPEPEPEITHDGSNKPTSKELQSLWQACNSPSVFARAVLARWGNRSAPQPVPMSERVQQIEDLAADAVSGLRYIEQQHGRLYGVGWDRVYAKADRLLSAG